MPNPEINLETGFRLPSPLRPTLSIVPFEHQTEVTPRDTIASNRSLLQRRLLARDEMGNDVMPQIDHVPITAPSRLRAAAQSP